MTTADTSSLSNSVREAIDQGRLGSPKFLRGIARTAESQRLDDSLRELKSLAQDWFGSSPIQSYRLGEGSQVYLTEMLKWPQGQAALLTAVCDPSPGAPWLDLILVGSRGTLYHEA